MKVVAVMKLEALGYTRDDFLLATDTAVVVPVNKTIVMQVTGADVIHSWTIPAFGVKQDAVPGRIAQLWFKPEVEGIFFGQCSELCGKDHAYMPIVIRAVTSEDAMTADWARIPYDVLETISTRIINEVRGVNRVALDLSSKPPATIEWE